MDASAHEEVREAVLDRVLPDADERAAARDLFDDIRAFIADEYGREAALMGSLAKDTFLSGDKDLDVFVFFDEDVEEDALEERGLAIGEAVFERFDGDHVVEYASHPYTKGTIDGYEVEIVPAYDVASGADITSAVDRTPFHTDWVDDHLSADEKQEVVLLKAFLRGQDLYGSTLKVEGFSGYLCELLIAAYGSFAAVVEAAPDWDEHEVIDPGDHHPDGLPPELEETFDPDNLVVVDPVDPDRNVAAVLSRENYARFIYAAWRYTREPSVGMFFPDEGAPSAEALRDAVAERGEFVTVTFPAPDVVDDLLYPQLRKLMDRLRQELRDSDVRIVMDGFHVGEEVRLVFELYSDTLPSRRVQRGPQVFHNVDHLQNFTDKYERVWVEDDRLVTIVDRAHDDAHALLEAFFTGDLAEKGVPSHLVDPAADAVVSGLTVEGDEAWRRFLRNTFHLA